MTVSSTVRRMCGNATSGVFLWLNADGMGDAAAFEPYSLSYWYNTLQRNGSAPRFDDGINASCRTSRMRDCHSMASPCTFSRCFDRDEQGVSSQ